MKYRSKKAVFFDFGDTLASTDPPYMVRIAMAMRKAGYQISDRDFEYEYCEADYKLYLKHKSEGGISPDNHRDWFFPILYDSLTLPDSIDNFRREIRDIMRGIEFNRVALPGVVEILDYLKSGGYVLGVISNNDGSTGDKCTEVGIREYFELIIDSTNVGLIKPDSRIFAHALENLGISPSEALHIGDLYGADVMGATDAGVDVVWLNSRKFDKFDDSAVNEISDLSELKKFFS